MVQMVRWVPSYCVIVQNDEVDALTKGEDVDCLLRVSTTLKDHVRAAAQALQKRHIMDKSLGKFDTFS